MANESPQPKRHIARLEIMDGDTTRVWLNDGSELIGLNDVTGTVRANGLGEFILKGIIWHRLTDATESVTP